MGRDIIFDYYYKRYGVKFLFFLVLIIATDFLARWLIKSNKEFLKKLGLDKRKKWVIILFSFSLSLIVLLILFSFPPFNLFDLK